VCAPVCAHAKKKRPGWKTPQLRLLHRCVAAARGLLLLLVEVSLLLLQLLIGHDFCKDMPGGGHSALSTRASALFLFIFLEDGKGQCYRIVDFVGEPKTGKSSHFKNVFNRLLLRPFRVFGMTPHRILPSWCEEFFLWAILLTDEIGYDSVQP
jgi:hypothetical protein